MPQLSSLAVSIPGLPGSEILVLVPLSDSDLIAVDSSGELLYRFNLSTPDAPLERIALQKAIPPQPPKKGYGFLRSWPPLTLASSPDGRWLAWGQTRGTEGGVIELESGHEVLTLHRKPYHESVSSFPLGFVSVENRIVLVHGTAWNRLDATDMASSKCLTERNPTSYTKDESKPPHYLDYFHSGLSVSPNGTWLITNGWVWSPWGYMAAWRTDAWLGGGESSNVWESEDGATKFIIEEASTHDFWERPHCWLDDDTMAFWGRGDDGEELEDAAGIYSLPERKLLCWLEGPNAREGFLAFDKDDGVLIAVSPKVGTTVWDIQSGAKLAEDSKLHPQLWHPGLKALIAIGGESDDAVHVIRWNH